MAGGITIDTGSLSLKDGVQLSASTFGVGNAGAITITATEAITLEREDSQGFGSRILSRVGAGAAGNSGGITIVTGSLFLKDGTRVSTNSFGVGNGGDITITATDAISIEGQNSQGFVSGIFSSVLAGAAGNSGGITIDTGSLFLKDGIELNASSFGVGNAGDITITATDVISLEGKNSQGSGNGIFSLVLPGAAGNSGDITIDTGSLFLKDGARLVTATIGLGDAGDITITATDVISLEGRNSRGTPSGILSSVARIAEGTAGSITIDTGSLFLKDGAQLVASTRGEGKAGDIVITANTLEATSGSQIQTNTTTNFDAADITLKISDNLFLSGEDSGLFAQTEGDGNAGKITIDTPQLTIDQGASISAFTEAAGEGGTITINAPQAVLLTDNSQLTVETSSAGKPGDITITTPNLTIGKDAEISATATETSTNTEGGGSITVNSANLDLTGKLGIFAETQGEAPAGTLNIQPDNNKPNLDIQFTDTAIISASTTAGGKGGNINLTAPETINITGQGKVAVETTGIGDAGSINITSQNFNISNQTEISASTLSSGRAGNINITTDTLTIKDGADIAVSSTASGTTGNINITADSITLDNQAKIEARAFSVDGGNIDLQVENLLTFSNNSTISATAGILEGAGNGGNIDINANFIVAFPENNEIIANAFEGTGGNINITTNAIFGFPEFLTISASSEFGLDGEVSINTPEVEPQQGLVNLPNTFATPPLDTSCQATNSANSSSFVNLGRGGLPKNPREIRSNQEIWDDLRSPVLESSPNSDLQPQSTKYNPIVEAQGWIVGDKGQIILVANVEQKDNLENYHPAKITNSCQDNHQLSNGSK